MRTRSGWRLITIGAVAAFLYSNFLLDVIFSPTHDWFAVVSELEVPGQPTATLLRVTDVVCAVLTLILLPSVRRALPSAGWRWTAVVMTALFAVGGILAAVVPLPCTSTEICVSASEDLERVLHDAFSVLSASTLFLGAGAVAIDTRHQGRRWVRVTALISFWIGGVLGTVLFLYFGWKDSTSWQTGIAQRFQIAMMSLWILALAIFGATSASRAEHDGPVPRQAVDR